MLDEPQVRRLMSVRRYAVKDNIENEITGQCVSAIEENSRMLPPWAFAISLLAQISAIALSWPLGPTLISVLFGASSFVAAILVMVWARVSFARQKVDPRPFTPVPQIVTTGPYRFSRNPMYLAFVLASASVALMTGISINLFAPLLLGAWLHFSYIIPEEKFLLQKFGNEFVAYRKRTPEWIGIPGSRARD